MIKQFAKDVDDGLSQKEKKLSSKSRRPPRCRRSSRRMPNERVSNRVPSDSFWTVSASNPTPPPKCSNWMTRTRLTVCLSNPEGSVFRVNGKTDWLMGLCHFSPSREYVYGILHNVTIVQHTHHFIHSETRTLTPKKYCCRINGKAYRSRIVGIACLYCLLLGSLESPIL